jgi:hypothetical protein
MPLRISGGANICTLENYDTCVVPLKSKSA